MIQWWCTALQRPWSWKWLPYPGVWLASLIPMGWYLWVTSRSSEPTTRTQKVQFIGGMVVFWIASDWPIGTLGAGYLASAHMLQFLLYTLGSVPLLMLGTPSWLAERVMARLRLRRSVAWFSRSLIFAGLIYNAGLVITHSPGVVDSLRTSQLGSFVMDVAWMALGVILWLPILSPVRDFRVEAVFGRIGYLFVTTSVVAIIPASFLTFSLLPLYSIYELAPRVASLTAQGDQQLAGIVMKLGTIPVVWSTLGAMWFRWAALERRISTPT